MERPAQTLSKNTGQLREARMAICRACPARKELPGRALLMCTKCGCVCNFKTTISAAKCPLGKW